MAWFLQLLLILYSWLPYITTQNVNHTRSTAIMILFYLSILAINYKIHEFKIREFLLTESFSMNLTSKPSPTTLPPLREIDETKIISDYLAEMYSKTPSISTLDNMHESASIRSTVSSVTFASLEGNSAISSVSISHVYPPKPPSYPPQPPSYPPQPPAQQDNFVHTDDTNTATSTITDGHTPTTPTSTLRERKSNRPTFAKERPLY